jgi:CheY-like chemotaxis protein
VGVDSAPGRGSTFFLRLPLEAAPRASSGSPQFDARGARALVVEDIDYNARALGTMLRRLGFAVELASDGREALARMTAVAYGAVFLDCDLPGISGADVARSFRAVEPPGRRTLIVATTALSTTRDKDACLAAGMDLFITKPITPEKLRSALAGAGCSPVGQAPADPAGAASGACVDLGMIRHLSDGTQPGFDRELSRFVASLDEAVLGIAAARATGSRPEMASAAHRVLSHARMVGAAGLAAAAADLQEFAPAYSESELADEAALVELRSAELRRALARVRRGRAGPRAGGALP